MSVRTFPDIISRPKFISMNGSSNVIMPIYGEGTWLPFFEVPMTVFEQKKNAREWFAAPTRNNIIRLINIFL